MMGSLPVALISLPLGFFGALFMLRYAHNLGLLDNPNQRSSHLNPTPRGGGIGLVPAFTVAALWAGTPFSFFLPVILVALISFYDDFSPLSSRRRLLAQLLLSLLVVVGGLDFLTIWSILLIPFWILFIAGTTNFYNFMDGINGIAGLTGVAGFGLVAVFSSLLIGNPDPIALAMLFACIGFLPFNFPRAKVFMGDVGSILLGFSFSGMVFLYSQDLPAFLCLVSFLFLFYADTLTTMLLRFRDGEPLTQAHRRHLYQVLCNEGGLAHWTVALSYFIIQLLIGAMMLIAWTYGIMWQVLLMVVCVVGYLLSGLKIRHHFSMADEGN